MKKRTKHIRGTGNVFRDLGDRNAETMQVKAILAAEVIKILDNKKLSVYSAQAQTGVSAMDFLQIRQANLGAFTADRLQYIITCIR